MKMHYLFLAMLLSVAAFSCKSRKTTPPSEPGVAPLNVSFYSIGSGINSEAVKAYDAIIAQFEKDKGVDIQFTVAHWGREGETDYCFDFSNLKAKVKDEFVALTKKEMEGKEHVTVSENFKCRPNRF